MVLGFIYFLVFGAIMLFILGIFYNLQYRREHAKLLHRMKQQMWEEIRPIPSGEEIRSISSEERMNIFLIIKNRFLKIIGSLGKRLKPENEQDLSYLRKRLLKGGYRKENTPVIFFGIKIFMAVLLPVIFFLVKLFLLKTMTFSHYILLSFCLALIGFYLPNVWLGIKISRRREKLMKGFPDALDLMVVCVEAGTGLDAAINRVGEEMSLSNKVLSEEFKLMSLELKAGKSRSDALRNLALRTDLEDVSSLATLLIQTEKFGTSIAQALRVYSDSMRTKRYQRAEEIAAKLPVKLVFPLIVFILPSLFIVVVGPAAIKIFRILLPSLGR